MEQTKWPSTDKPYFVIMEHLKRMEEKFDKFMEDYVKSKQLEKFNEVMKAVWEYIEDQHSYKYAFKTDYDPCGGIFTTQGDWNQLPMSICIKHLARDRVLSMWKATFPKHDIQSLLDAWVERKIMDGDHIVYGYHFDSPNAQTYLDMMKKVSYDEEDVKVLLGQLTLAELASITPKISCISYTHIKTIV